MRKLTTEEFKQKFEKKYGKLYDLSKVDYINNKTEVTVICPIHGEFHKRPDLLLDGCKCPKCSKTARTTEDDFIKKAKYVHNNFFEYEKGSFVNVSSKVGVICPIHGIFYQKANNHLNGANCPKCKHDKIIHKITKLQTKNKSTVKYDTDTFVKKVQQLYGDKYILENIKYVNNRTPIYVGCKEHGYFSITPNHLLSGRGCSKCSKNYHYTTDEIIEKFKEIHGDKYIYDKTKYTRTHDNITVTCKIHGNFEISPSNHLNGEGCPKCNNSKLEEEIRLLLEKKDIKYIFRERKIDWLNGLELDFYLPEYNVAIECQGIQHFKPVSFFGGEENFNNLKEHDENKKRLCEKNGIKLLYYSNLGIDYPYHVFEDKKELLNEIIK
jgi:Zn ribbon nucleic-acid-binding protein